MPVSSPTILKAMIASIVHENVTLGDLEGWFRWLLQFNMDLSEANIDSKFYVWTMLFVVAQHPEWFPPKFRSIGEKIRKGFEKSNQIALQIFREGFI